MCSATRISWGFQKSIARKADPRNIRRPPLQRRDAEKCSYPKHSSSSAKNCSIITDMAAEESDVDDVPRPTTICLCVSSPKTSPSNDFPNHCLEQADGSSGRCQSPTGLTFISRRAGDGCQRDTHISEEAPLVRSGGVRDTSVHNNSVKCLLSTRVCWAKN